ncbi:MAG: L-seryl-tRNA(Sec) selenium transferase [Planctomycetota bacterium]|nr:L-seryl-tRNA(Sec) selenium transferase [Planctomycetota bacterium]
MSALFGTKRGWRGRGFSGERLVGLSGYDGSMKSPAPTGRDASLDGKATHQLLRDLPAVDAVLRHLDQVPGAALAVRKTLDDLRQALRSGESNGLALDAPAVAELARERLLSWAEDIYPRVVNATGVVLHTGLGRAPLAEPAVAALSSIGDGYSLLEVDPVSGERKDRESRLLDDLRALTGAEAATVVNNNASALLLALTALAKDREVLVSRGELIEIGGGFRLPDLLEQSGARLREVGTTNRTYVSDYQKHLKWETGLVLSMHTSNYRVVGFTHRPEIGELAKIAKECGVPVLEDIGSGLLVPSTGDLASEPDARTALESGVDLVCFSGDKLLGGPQAGLLLGRKDLVERCRSHPLFRALRPDRLALAALGATLRLHREAPQDVPVLAALSASPAHRLERARSLRSQLASVLPGVGIEVVASEASAGSGSLPARPLGSSALELHWPGLDGESLAKALRALPTPIFSRVWQGQVRLDVAALVPGDEARLARLLADFLSCSPGPEA